MRIVIDIDEELYEHAINDTYYTSDEADAINAIKSGTELVTCNECKYWCEEIAWNGEKYMSCFISPLPAVRKADDFCSLARRGTYEDL